MRPALLALACIIPPAVPCAVAAEPAPGAGLSGKLDAAVKSALLESRVPSVSVGRIDKGRIAWLKAWGEQRPGVPATTETLYNIASLTKPITAETVLRLASLGRLSLEEPMSPVWLDPDIKDDPRSRLLTPRLALSHRTGFPNWRAETGGRLTFRWSPGSSQGYSGEGFEYLARFTERRLGEPFERLADEHVLRRFGMTRTSYTSRPWFAGHVAIPTDTEGRALMSVRRYSYIASDDVHTTAGDYARFLVHVASATGLAANYANQRKSVQASTREALCAGEKARTCPDAAGHGLGWDIAVFGKDRVLWHTGSDAGEFTFAYVVPRTGEGMVILTNSARGYLMVLPILTAAGAHPPFLAFLRAQAG